VTLGALLAALGADGWSSSDALDAAARSREVTAVAYDSRRVAPGTVFVAWRGQHADGVSFAEQAIARGAAAVVAEATRPAGLSVPWIQVSDARLALARLAAAFQGHPSDDLLVVGITGTNGKTTTSYLLSAIFDRAGVPCGRLGTVSYRIRDEERAAPHTTPEAPELQGLLREMVERGCRACVMEVSSHALALRRVDATRFGAAVFTNLTRDHLDFHADMEAYFVAKRRLFEMLGPDRLGVVNADDPVAPRLVATAPRPVTFAIDRAADVTPGPIASTLAGLQFEIRTPRGTVHAASRLIGRPNVYNILAAVTTSMALDVPFNAIERAIANVDSIPGRFQVVSDAADEVQVIVDYAHTDDALRNLLETARSLTSGRLITVFGCGGDRDRSKRPLMGAVAARLSDVVVVTSDNPRSEEPEAIIAEIMRGIQPPADRVPRAEAGSRGPACLSIPDRSEAIARAIRQARPGDLVLLAGKGHETYQVIGERVLPFDDVEAARAALARRRTGTAVQ
jgi:UDP-N-acetylmuramoyl-L-alanyl-D-glutamate--2,6-diaminopimelate ligase